MEISAGKYQEDKKVHELLSSTRWATQKMVNEDGDGLYKFYAQWVFRQKGKPNKEKDTCQLNQ